MSGLHNKTLILAHAHRGGSGGSSVTSVTIWYNGQDVSTYGGLLLFTGTTYSLTAKDQLGNVLSNASGTWGSSDATNFPVNSSGVAAPASGIGGGTITFTHTASGVVGTVLVSVLTAPPAVYKGSGTFTDTTALMGQIANYIGTDPTYNSGLPAPTGTGTVLYFDGQGANHFFVDSTTPSRQFMGNPVMVDTLPTTTPVHDGSLATAISGITRFWSLQVVRFDPGFTMVGQGPGAAAFKIGNWGIFSPGGRVGMELTNGNSSGGTGGHPGGNFDLGCGLADSGGTLVGGSATQTLPDVTTEFYAGEVWVNLLLYEVRGGNIMSSRVGWWKIGSVPDLTFGNSGAGLTVEGPMFGDASPGYRPPDPTEVQPTPVNYNQAPPYNQLYISLPLWQIVDGDTYGDPYGVLGDTSSPTLTAISGGTVARGDTADNVVLTGTNFTKNCWPVFSNAKIYPQSITINSSTQMTVVVAVDSTATTGAGTVLVHNGSSLQDSGTKTVTVT